MSFTTKTVKYEVRSVETSGSGGSNKKAKEGGKKKKKNNNDIGFCVSGNPMMATKRSGFMTVTTTKKTSKKTSSSKESFKLF